LIGRFDFSGSDLDDLRTMLGQIRAYAPSGQHAFTLALRAEIARREAEVEPRRHPLIGSPAQALKAALS
jgi:hypothetical protein